MDRNLGLTSVYHAKFGLCAGIPFPQSLQSSLGIRVVARAGQWMRCCWARLHSQGVSLTGRQPMHASPWPRTCLPPIWPRLPLAYSQRSGRTATRPLLTAALTEAGLTLANRFFAAGVAGGPYPAVVKAVAALVGKGASAAAEECLAEALPSRLSEPTMTAWSVSSIFAIHFFCCPFGPQFSQMGSMAQMTCMAPFDLRCEESRCVRSGTCQRAPRRSWNSALLSPAHFADA